ncbi:MAG TPA: hypothetical protein VN174_00220 [Candidatus Methanoperedens sp.]|nr:hypothetical protein [Candidatus Methanoperedens sp.]
MQKNKLSQYFLILGIFTFLAIFFFVIQQSYSNLMKASSETKNSPLVRSVSPNLDIDILDEIEKRQETNL